MQIAGLISSTARIDMHHRAFRAQRGVLQRIARGRLAFRPRRPEVDEAAHEKRTKTRCA